MEPTTIATLAAAGWKITKWLTGKPKKKKLSPVYKVREDEIRISEESALPIVYGHCKVKGQNIYREDTIASVYDLAVAFCEGEIEEIEDIRIDGMPLDKFTTFAATLYTGTTTQIGDDRFKEGVFNLVPTDDAYADSGFPDTAFHWEYANQEFIVKELHVKISGGSELLRSYLRYDLSELPGNLTIDSAELKVMTRYTHTDGAISVWTAATASDWAENTLTWNNKPADDASAVDSSQSLSVNNKIVTFNLNTAAKTYLTTAYQNNSFATLFLKSPGTNVYVTFASTESEYMSPTLVLHFSGGEACGFRNTAYIACTIDTTDERLTNAFNPEFTAYIKGRKIKVWDAVNSDWNVEYSTNPAWIIFDLLTTTRLGLDLTSDDLNVDSFKTVAAYCDVLILNLDNKYEKRFECNIVIDDLDNIKTYLEDILTTFGGFLYSKDGKIHLGIEKAESVDADFALDINNIIAGSFSYSQIPKDKIPNVVKILYTDPEKDFRKVFLRVDDEIDIAERGEVIKEIPCYGINSRSQASRIANHILWKGKLAQYAFKCRVSINQCHVLVGELCEVTHTIPNWTSKKFRIVSTDENLNDEIEIVGEEYVSSLYGDEGIVSGYDEIPVIEDWTELPPATGLTLTETYKMNDDGTYQPQINVAFTIPDYVLGKDKLEFYVWWRASADAYSVSRFVWATGSPIKIDVPGAGTYYVRVQTFVYQPWDIMMRTTDAPEDSIAIVGLGLGVIPAPHGFVWSVADSKAAWTTGIITYKGVKYEINSGATAAPYIYFDRNVDIDDLLPSVTRPAASIDMFVMAYYDSVTGTVEPALSGKIIHAGLLQAHSITANEITTGELITETAQIKNAILTDAKISGTITVGHTDAKCTDPDADQTSVNTATNTAKVQGYTIIEGGYIKTDYLTANNIVTGTLTGRTVQTAASGKRAIMSGADGLYYVYNTDGYEIVRLGYALEEGYLRIQDYPANDIVTINSGNLIIQANAVGHRFTMKLDTVAKVYIDSDGDIWTAKDLDVDGNIACAGTVDGVNIYAHAHSGAGQGGTVDHGSLDGIGEDDHHAESHTIASHSDQVAHDDMVQSYSTFTAQFTATDFSLFTLTVEDGVITSHVQDT